MTRNDTPNLQAGAAELLQTLQVDPESGLTPAEAKVRLARFGHNEVDEKKVHPLWLLAKKFWGLSAWMLEMVIVLSWFLHHYSDMYIVSALLVVNALFSFMLDQRASGAVAMLRSRLQIQARVRRGAAWGVLPARELVPGDIIRLRSGDLTPADVKVISGDLGVDQSTLTGESLEVDKGADSVLYAGSIVRRGEATGIVVLTGARTYFGRTTELVQLARPKMHVEVVVSQLVGWLFVVVGVPIALALIYSLLHGLPLLDLLPLMLVLLLGAVPLSLPVMLTVSVALGAMQLAKKGVLVTRRTALDDAATMDVLCVDKTGTITTNRLAVSCVVPLDGLDETGVLRYGALASKEANQDAIDVALLAAAQQRGALPDQLVHKSFTPFDAQTRRTEATVEVDGREVMVMKGAVPVIAGACGLGAADIAALEARATELARGGQRTLAIALAEGDAAPHLVGLVTLSDAPRPDAARLIAKLKGLGVAVKMLTGDALPIAREVARTVGLGESISRAADLQQRLEVDPQGAGEMAEASDGLAEIYPEGKYAVVKSLQARRHVVGMTGDGVNDAPALRQAEVGIAVSSATDVAKGAASVVLTDEGMGGIIDLVQNGRMIYHRITTWMVNKISRTIFKTLFVVLSLLITGRLVVSAFAMLLITFMTDFVKISLSTDNVKWSKTPEKWDMASLVKVAVVLGLLMTVEAFALLYIGFARFGLHASEQALGTYSFEILFYFALFSILAVRERGHFWDSLPSGTMLAAMGIDLVVGTLLTVIGFPGLQPLPIAVTAFVAGFALVFSLIINDTIKWLVFRRSRVQW